MKWKWILSIRIWLASFGWTTTDEGGLNQRHVALTHMKLMKMASAEVRSYDALGAAMAR